jgi:Family of unknown function (DUF6152)
MKSHVWTVAIGAALCGVSGAQAHHSYAMFDEAKTQTVSGTVAKLEWINPHVFIWVYVPVHGVTGKYDLYAFENASPNILERLQWTANTLRAGEPITVVYAPLRDGRSGGHWIFGKLGDGRILRGAGGPANRPHPDLEAATPAPAGARP